MFVLKKQYYLYIKNTKDLDIKRIKKRNKFTVIYNSNKPEEKFDSLVLNLQTPHTT